MRFCRLLVEVEAEYRSVVFTCIELIFRNLLGVEGDVFVNPQDD